MASGKTLHVPVTGGIRQDIADNAAPPGTLKTAQNVRFPADGEIEARPGTVSLSLATDAPVAFSALNESIATLQRCKSGFFIGAEGFGYNYDQSTNRLHTAGSYSNAEPLGIFWAATLEQDAGSNSRPCSQAYAAGHYAFSFFRSGGSQPNLVTFWTADRTLEETFAIASVDNTIVVADKDDRMVVLAEAAGGDIKAYPVTLADSGPSVSPIPTTVGTLLSADEPFAACTVPGVGWAFIYRSAAAVMTIKVLRGTTVLGTQTFAVTAGYAGGIPVSIYSDGTYIWIAWVDGAALPWTLRAIIYTTALVLVTSGVLETENSTNPGCPMFGPHPTTGSAMWAYTRDPSAYPTTSTWVTTGELNVDGTLTEFPNIYQCALLSPPFGPGYIWVRAYGQDGATTTPFSRPVLLDLMQVRETTSNNRTQWGPVIALSKDLTIGEAAASGTVPYTRHISQPATEGDGVYVHCVPHLVRSDGSGLEVFEYLKFQIGGRRQTIRLGEEVLAAGWLTLSKTEQGTQYLDATYSYALQRNGQDVGLPLFATAISSGTPSNGAGSLTSASVYQYRFVLERIDSMGRRWRGAPSLIRSVTTGGSDNTITFASLIANTNFLRADTNKQAGASGYILHAYRTAANGSTFYRATPAVGGPSPSSTGAVAFTDTLSDASLIKREILYTDGGVFQNDPPQCCRFVRATEDRVWLGGLWETKELQSSKILVPGEPPQFSDSEAFFVPLPDDCTGLAIQDGIVIAFCRNAIYAIQGAGPNDQGQGAWDSPRCITKSTGCINHHSILETSIGVFFQSEAGIELLPRGAGEPQFIGMPVQDYTIASTGDEIVAATVVNTFRGRTARFVQYGATAARVLVYDLDSQAWSVDDYGATPVAICDTDYGATLLFEDPFAGITTALQERMDQDQDGVGGTPVGISSTLEWADLRPFGPAVAGSFCGATILLDERQSPSTGYQSGTAIVKLSVDDRAEGLEDPDRVIAA